VCSQNNNNGGYACQRAVGDETMQNEMGLHYYSQVSTTDDGSVTFNQSMRMYYYEGSVLPIEWTNQHGCGGNSKVSCEIVLQYACEDTLDPRVDNFWPWVTNKAGNTSTYYGKQHFRDTTSSPENIAAPRDGVPDDSNDAATDTITNTEAAAIPNTVGKYNIPFVILSIEVMFFMLIFQLTAVSECTRTSTTTPCAPRLSATRVFTSPTS
jgi:hypothetical protein